MKKQKLTINGNRLRQTLEEFSYFGKMEKNGVTRLSLSEEDRDVREYFGACCEQLGMSVKVDDLGNMYATLEGIEDKPPIVIGSHLDSVKKGGRFDGVLGVVAGLEIVRTFVENKMKPRVPIMIVNFTNEEGARFEPSMMASGILSGKFDKTEMFQKRDIEGITVEEALQTTGYNGEESARLKEGTAFLELHIEQGPILEREVLSIGVVECVVGMVCYEIEVSGESDHAGTTPMEMRKDALFTTNDIIQIIRQKLATIHDKLVFTIGRMNIFPNVHTVIPNKVVFTLEARHKNPAVMKEVEHIIEELSSLTKNEGCHIRTNKLWDRSTVWFDEDLLDVLNQSVKSLGYSHKRMVSGAGHDAQFIASYIPTAMVFVPSINGKSHCETELTLWEDCTKGVNVLLEAVMYLQT